VQIKPAIVRVPGTFPANRLIYNRTGPGGGETVRQQFKMLLFLVLTFSIFGILQFLACTTIAITLYPRIFSFSENYLSDLGRKSFDYHYLFNGSLILLGVSLIPLYGLLKATDPKRSVMMTVTSVFGVISASGLIGLGLTPIDRMFVLHHVALGIWLFPMLYMSVTFFVAASRSPYVGVGFLSASLIMVIVMIATLLRTEITSYVLMQKAIVGCGIVWLLYVILFMFQSGVAIIRDWESEVDQRALKETEYCSTLMKENRRKHGSAL
jgi:hypothetical membrane protein